MAEPEPPSLADLLRHVRFQYPDALDLSQTDPDTLRELARRITNAAYRFNLLVVSAVGGRSGPERTPGLVEQVVGTAFQGFGGVDPHPHPFEKAAVLLRGIAQGHPFTDGNKRTGFLTALSFLDQLGYAPPEQFPVAEVVEFCTAISSGQIRDSETIAYQLALFYRRGL